MRQVYFTRTLVRYSKSITLWSYAKLSLHKALPENAVESHLPALSLSKGRCTSQIPRSEAVLGIIRRATKIHSAGEEVHVYLR